MKKELFDELLESLQEGAAVLQGEAAAARSFEMSEAKIRDIRKNLNLSQNEFAALIGISAATLRNWEQGRRKPEGPARVLLQIASRHPRTFLDLVPDSENTISTNSVDSPR